MLLHALSQTRLSDLADHCGHRTCDVEDTAGVRHRGWGAVRTSRLCCGEPEKRQHSRQFGNHLGNPGSIFILSFAVSFA
jgi:hypothetical protein